MWATCLLRFSPLPPLQTLTLTLTLTRRHGSPSSTIHTPPSTKRRILPRPPISMSYRPANTIPASDRLLAALSYSLPFLNSLHYGRFLFSRFPSLALSLDPLLPLIAAYRSLPYASFLAFFAIYLGVVRNPAFSRYVRFNAMQAVVLDVLLALPALLQRIFGVPARGLGFRLLELSYNAIFVAAAGCFLYGLVSCVLGKTPYLPLVASAADRQL